MGKIVDSIIVSSPRKYSDEEKAQITENWLRALSDLSKEQLDIGWDKALKQPPEFGVAHPGWFLELCLSGDGAKSFEDDANEIWEMIVLNLDGYSSPVFKDPVIAESIRNMGGWKHLCMMEIKEIPFRKKEFVKNYAVLKRSNGKFDPVLIGAFKKDVKFIGDFKEEEKEQILIGMEKKDESDNKIMAMITDGENEMPEYRKVTEKLLGKTIESCAVGHDNSSQFQGEVIKISPLKILGTDGNEYFCRGDYTLVESVI